MIPEIGPGAEPFVLLATSLALGVTIGALLGRGPADPYSLQSAPELTNTDAAHRETWTDRKDEAA